jgi:hypothetical protein
MCDGTKGRPSIGEPADPVQPFVPAAGVHQAVKKVAFSRLIKNARMQGARNLSE